MFHNNLKKLFSNTVKMVRAPTIQLNNGIEMPVIGLGTYKSRKGEGEEAIKAAIDCGYRHIDTAYVYLNEEEVGRAVNAKIADGTVKREELFIVTKLAGIHHDSKLVEHACRLSLKKLGLDYVDLYLIHYPIGNQYVADDHLERYAAFSDIDYVDTWKAMEKLVPLGLARSIGLSNFNSEQTERVLENCEIKPVTNQVECHPALNQRKLIAFSKQRGIILTAYCPLARPRPAEKCPPFLYDEKTEAIAKKYGKTTTQVCLRYLLNIGVVPIPKSVTKARIEMNFDVFDFQLNDEDMTVMDSFNTNERICPFTPSKDHPYFPFGIEF